MLGLKNGQIMLDSDFHAERFDCHVSACLASSQGRLLEGLWQNSGESCRSPVFREVFAIGLEQLVKDAGGKVEGPKKAEARRSRSRLVAAMEKVLINHEKAVQQEQESQGKVAELEQQIQEAQHRLQQLSAERQRLVVACARVERK